LDAAHEQIVAVSCDQDIVCTASLDAVIARVAA
jgi:hypothetical protein